MKRYILVDSRIAQDKETKGNLLFLKLYKLLSKMKSGGLWHPKDSEAIANYCISELNDPMSYENYLSLKPGSLFDVTFGVNDFNGKLFVAKCDYVSNSDIHSENDLYI